MPPLHAAAAYLAIAGVGLLLHAQAHAEERKRPLQIQIPSIPATAPNVDVVDNNLPVHLLDAQVESKQNRQSVSDAVRRPATVSSGRLALGKTPRKAINRHRQPVAAFTPPVSVTPSELPPAVNSQSSPQVSASAAAPAAGSTPPSSHVLTLPEKFMLPGRTSQKAFLNGFVMQPPRDVSQAQAQPNAAQAKAPRQQMPEAVSKTSPPAVESSLTAVQPAVTPSRITAIIPETAPTPEVVAEAPDAKKKAAKDSFKANKENANSINAQDANAQDKVEKISKTLADSTQSLQQTLSALDASPASPLSLAALPTLAEAKQAFAPQQDVSASAIAMVEAPTISIAEAQVQAQSQIQPQIQPQSQAQVQAVSSASPPSTMLPPTPSSQPQGITELPSLEQVKQAFAKPENSVKPAEIAAREVIEKAQPLTVASAAGALADLAPAAGEAEDVSAGQHTAAAMPAEPDSPAITADMATLSPDSAKLLERIPAKIDTPKNAKKQRVDIERERVTASVFSELDGAKDAASELPAELTVDVKRPALDTNYELQRAYDALLSGQTDLARESYQRVLAVEPKNIQALFGMGALLHRAGALDDARRYYAKILAQDPDHRDTLNNFLSLVAEEAPEQALDKLKELEMKNPDFSPIPAQIAFIYQKLQNLRMAAQYMIKALALAPNNLTYKYNLAILLDKLGSRPDAAAYYQDLVDAHLRGETIPGNIASIQERLTFIRSNR